VKVFIASNSLELVIVYINGNIVDYLQSLTVSGNGVIDADT